MSKNPFRRRLSKDAAANAIADLMNKKTMSAKMQRVMFARASAAKHFIIKVLAPDLLDLRARHQALERYILESADLHKRADIEEQLRQYRKTALNDLHEKDRLKHLGGDNNADVWAGVERAMIRDIYRKQRKPLMESAGIEEPPPVPEGQDPQSQE